MVDFLKFCLVRPQMRIEQYDVSIQLLKLKLDISHQFLNFFMQDLALSYSPTPWPFLAHKSSRLFNLSDNELASSRVWSYLS